MAADVFLWRLPGADGTELGPPDLRPGLDPLLAAAGPLGTASGGGPAVLKVHVGPPGRPAAILPIWAHAVAAAAGCPGATFTDTLSISTRGLDTAPALAAVAAAKGYPTEETSAAAGGRFVVGDGPEAPAPLPAPPVPGGRLEGLELAGILRGAGSLVVLNPVRAHPHLGVVGAVATLGLELASRDTKLRLHVGIRPQVDTPLCAGCGSCLDVCLYDAIVIRAGRALIDHHLCTGCGECMGVCFMAGIAPEEAGGLARFQQDVAESAVAVGLAEPAGRAGGRSVLYLNFMIQLGGAATASKARRRLPVAGIGILASRDPVALDAASLSCLEAGVGVPLAEWTGYAQGPGDLLGRAEALGLGSREHRLREV